MKSLLICLACLLAGSVVHAADDVVATVNGKPILKSVVDVLVVDQGLSGQPQEADFRKYAREQLVQREVMAQQAIALKLDKTPALQAQFKSIEQGVQAQFAAATPGERNARIAFNTQGVLAQAFAEDFARKHAPTDAAMHEAYKKMTAGLGGVEYKVRHIQLATEDEAKAVIGKLAGGSKFSALAAQSLDLGSKDNGGDLGWIKTDGLPAGFSEAVRQLKTGSYTKAPVKTDMGYHVILLEAKRNIPVGSFESYKAEIKNNLQQQMLGEEVRNLVGKAIVN